MVIGKRSFVIMAAFAGGVLWIEHAHRIKVEPSMPAEVAVHASAVCPENESVPFSADCMAFIEDGDPLSKSRTRP